MTQQKIKLEKLKFKKDTLKEMYNKFVRNGIPPNSDCLILLGSILSQYEQVLEEIEETLKNKKIDKV